jgi:hypothetical protein
MIVFSRGSLSMLKRKEPAHLHSIDGVDVGSKALRAQHLAPLMQIRQDLLKTLFTRKIHKNIDPTALDVTTSYMKRDLLVQPLRPNKQARDDASYH